MRSLISGSVDGLQDNSGACVAINVEAGSSSPRLGVVNSWE